MSAASRLSGNSLYGPSRRRIADHFLSRVVAAFWCSPRRRAASRGGGRSRHWARSGVSISGAATRKNRRIWLLRPSRSFGSGRRQAARQPALSASGAASQSQWRMPGPAFVRRTGPRDRHRSSRPSCRASSSRVPAAGHRRAALRMIRKGIARAGVSPGAGSFAGPLKRLERRSDDRLHGGRHLRLQRVHGAVGAGRAGRADRAGTAGRAGRAGTAGRAVLTGPTRPTCLRVLPAPPAHPVPPARGSRRTV
jgi:hypothetical protein